jgi:hypothetical protein
MKHVVDRVRGRSSVEVARLTFVGVQLLTGLLLISCERRQRLGADQSARQSGIAASTSTSHLQPAPPPRVTAEEPSEEPPLEEQSADPASSDGEEQPAPRSFGPPSPTCINGWTTPPRGSPLRKAALDMMRTHDRERFVVTEMRYFVGPEDAEVISTRGEVERWYVKAYTAGGRQRQHRWLIRRAPVGRGVDALADYDSTGYGPRTWTRVDTPDESLADPFQHPCNTAKPEEKCMGLPREVLGCLDGT